MTRPIRAAHIIHMHRSEIRDKANAKAIERRGRGRAGEGHGCARDSCLGYQLSFLSSVFGCKLPLELFVIGRGGVEGIASRMPFGQCAMATEARTRSGSLPPLARHLALVRHLPPAIAAAYSASYCASSSASEGRGAKSKSNRKT